MEFVVEEKVKFPRDLVYKTLRDKLKELVPYIPNVKKIEVLKKQKKKKGVYYENKWYGDYKIPKIVQKIVKVEELTWMDYAQWIDDEYACEWKLEPVFFKEYVDAYGRNEYVEKGGETIVRLTGVLDVDASSHPLVPRLFARRVNKEVERMAMYAIKPNLKKLLRGLREFLGTQE